MIAALQPPARMLDFGGVEKGGCSFFGRNGTYKIVLTLRSILRMDDELAGFFSSSDKSLITSVGDGFGCVWCRRMTMTTVRLCTGSTGRCSGRGGYSGHEHPCVVCRVRDVAVIPLHRLYRSGVELGIRHFVLGGLLDTFVEGTRKSAPRRRCGGHVVGGVTARDVTHILFRQQYVQRKQ